MTKPKDWHCPYCGAAEPDFDGNHVDWRWLEQMGLADVKAESQAKSEEDEIEDALKASLGDTYGPKD